METYEEVADESGLLGDVRDRFVKYMRTRWADTEGQKCQDGYAAEWAGRFKGGLEFACSDSVGQMVLAKMEKEGR